MREIKLTAGRVVHYHRGGREDVPLAATIACVHNNRCVNLTVHETNGTVTPRVSAPFRQPGDRELGYGVSFAEWMPFQIKKSYGSESGEHTAGMSSI